MTHKKDTPETIFPTKAERLLGALMRDDCAHQDYEVAIVYVTALEAKADAAQKRAEKSEALYAGMCKQAVGAVALSEKVTKLENVIAWMYRRAQSAGSHDALTTHSMLLRKCVECGVDAAETDWLAKFEAAQKRVTELEEALRPFAVKGEDIADMNATSRVKIGDGELVFIGVGDLRRAAAVLGKDKEAV